MSKVASLWPLWVAVTLAATVKPFAWHLSYFRHPGAHFLPLYLGALVLLGLAAWWYPRFRAARPGAIPWELRVFSVFFVFFCGFYEPQGTFYVLLTLFVCFSLGRLALGRVAEGTLEQLTLWPAAGLGILSAVLFVLGMLRLYYRSLALALLAGAALLFWRNARRIWDLLQRAAAGYAATATSPLWGVSLPFVFAFTVASVMVALSPEIAFDPVSFHFVLARDYAAQHRLAIIDHLHYSYFPQNVEVLYALGFLLEGQATAKLLTYAFFPLAAMSLALLGRRWFSDSGALVGAAFFWTTPFIAWTGSVAKNDMALTAYLLLALYGLIRWIEDRRFAWLATAAMFLGFSFGVKHVAVLAAVPMALLVLWHVRGRLSFRGALLATVIFAASGLFWHARTWVLAGNPLYPEFGSSAVRSTTAAGHPEYTWVDWVLTYLRRPFEIHFQGLKGAFEAPTDNPMGFVLVAFLPLLFLRGGLRSRGAKLLLVFAGVYLMYWAGILVKVRYAMVPFGVLFVYVADRISAWYEPGGAARRASILALAGYCFAFALSVALIMEMNGPRLKLFTRRIDRQQFLRESLVTYRSIEALNRVAKPGERAYAVGNCSTFYANIEFHCYYDHRDNYSLEKVADDIRRLNFQYLLVANEWAEPGHLHVVESHYHPVLLYQDESFRLYRLWRFR